MTAGADTTPPVPTRYCAVELVYAYTVELPTKYVVVLAIKLAPILNDVDVKLAVAVLFATWRREAVCVLLTVELPTYKPVVLALTLAPIASVLATVTELAVMLPLASITLVGVVPTERPSLAFNLVAI